jgi:hypothetical protein
VFQSQALSTRLGIPIFYGVDAVHGDSARRRSSRSWPRQMAQIPIDVGDPRCAPLFECGFGLSW